MLRLRRDARLETRESTQKAQQSGLRLRSTSPCARGGGEAGVGALDESDGWRIIAARRTTRACVCYGSQTMMGLAYEVASTLDSDS